MTRLFISLCLLIALSNSMIAQNQFFPPETPQKPETYKMHGFEFTDPYIWLENRASAETLEWSKQQHQASLDYIKSHTRDIPGLRDEIRAYLDRDQRGAPFFKGKREFFYLKKKGEQQSKLYTKIGKKEILIFDPEKYDPSGKSAIVGIDFTEDGSRAAIGLQFKGNEIGDYRIVDTETGKQIGDVITGLSGFRFTKDEKHAYITVRTREIIEKQTPLPVYLHKLGANRKEDKFLIAPKDAKDFAGIWDSDEGNRTFISEGDFWSNSLKIFVTGTNEAPRTIYQSSQYKANPHIKGNKIYFYTNHSAPNYKLMVAELDKPEFENWREFLPEREEMLESYVITSDYVIAQTKRDISSGLTLHDLSGNFIRKLELPETASVGGISYHKETNAVFVSLLTVNSTSRLYKLDGKTLKWEFFWQDEPPIDTKEIDWKVVYYPSTGGVKVPMIIAHKKGIKLDGNNPTLLYGYGGFNHGIKPHYIGLTASFVNRGGVYCIAGIRGGNEYGEKWHEYGMMFKKQNTFDDFIAAAEYLISEKYTNPERLAVKGGSNGGLLIGAITVQRPDLFKAGICAVPLLDMIRYHKFLIARYWIPEYGNPDKKDEFLNLLGYSPYHRIYQGLNYPSLLIKAGENDARVDPCHAKKFAAALQNNFGQKNPILLYVDFESGHGSGKSTEQTIEDVENDWRYIFKMLGM